MFLNKKILKVFTYNVLLAQSFYCIKLYLLKNLLELSLNIIKVILKESKKLQHKYSWLLVQITVSFTTDPFGEFITPDT